MACEAVLFHQDLEVLMLRYTPIALFLASSIFVTSCADDTVVQTGQIVVEWDRTVDFSQFETFSVVTSDQIPLEDLPDLEEDQMVFNDMVNELIKEAMQAEPVCMTFIEPDAAADNPPDLWAANGVAQTTDDGWYYDCIGGWWWGYWGWYWDPCAWWVPRYIEYDVGNLLIPVGPPPAEGGSPEPIFGGLAQSLSDSPPDTETKVRQAVQAIFEQWPVKNQCPQ
jgi:hypothetical protein